MASQRFARAFSRSASGEHSYLFAQPHFCRVRGSESLIRDGSPANNERSEALASYSTHYVFRIRAAITCAIVTAISTAIRNPSEFTPCGRALNER